MMGYGHQQKQRESQGFRPSLASTVRSLPPKGLYYRGITGLPFFIGVKRGYFLHIHPLFAVGADAPLHPDSPNKSGTYSGASNASNAIMAFLFFYVGVSGNMGKNATLGYLGEGH
jgi:hypothetical protein